MGISPSLQAWKGWKWMCESLSRVRLFATHGLQPTRLLCPWNSPGTNTGVCCHSLLQGIFPTQGSNPVSRLAGRFFTICATRDAFERGEEGVLVRWSQDLGSCSGPQWDSTGMNGLVSVHFQARDMKEKVQSGEVTGLGYFLKFALALWIEYFSYTLKKNYFLKKFTAF